MKTFKYYKSAPLVIFIAILIVLAQLSNNVLGPIISDALPENIKPQILQIADYLGVFGVMGQVSLVLALINQRGWRYKVFQWLIDLPDMRGRYIGELISDYDGGTTKKAAIEIKQTASKIKVNGYFADPQTGEQTSLSYSVNEMIVQGTDGIFTVVYLFTNEPGLLQTQLQQHGGTMELKYFPDIKKLQGNYYNKRKNLGTLEVTFDSNKTLGRYQ